MILAIETSGSRCAVALGAWSGGQTEPIGSFGLEIPKAHSEKLLQMVELLLGHAGVDKQELKGIAYSMGPGSFTGLRIGLSAAKGLCFALDLPLVGIPTLDIIASRIREMGRFHVVTNSRKQEYYHAVYENSDRRSQIEVVSEENLAGQIEEGDLLVCPEASGILARLPEKIREGMRVLDGSWARPEAEALLNLAGPRFETGDVEELASVVPLYIQGFRGKAMS